MTPPTPTSGKQAALMQQQEAPESHQRISRILRIIASNPQPVTLPEWSEFVNDIGTLMLADLSHSSLTAANEGMRGALENARGDLAVSWGKAEGAEADRLAIAMRLIDVAILANVRITEKLT